MKLDAYQLAILQTKRSELRDETVTVVTITVSGSQTDFMGASVTRTKTETTVDCKVGWGNIIEKDRETGGDVIIGDCRILISLDDKGNVDSDNVYLKDSNGTELQIVRIIPAYDTNECVIYCKRRS